MKDRPLWFAVVPQEDREFSNHLELGPFPSNFILSSVLGPILMADEELGFSREGVDLFKSKAVKFSCVVFQIQDNNVYSLGIDDPPNDIDFCIIPLF